MTTASEPMTVWGYPVRYHLTNPQVAELLDVHPTTAHRWRDGSTRGRIPDPASLGAIIEALGLDKDEAYQEAGLRTRRRLGAGFLSEPGNPDSYTQLRNKWAAYFNRALATYAQKHGIVRDGLVRDVTNGAGAVS